MGDIIGINNANIQLMLRIIPQSVFQSQEIIKNHFFEVLALEIL